MKRILLLIILLLCLLPTPVFAVDSPDTIDILSTNVYRNILETGDQLYIVMYNVHYTSVPDDSITVNYLARLTENDGTPLQTVPIYSDAIIPNKGYDFGLFSFYFSAADAPTWDSNYIVRLDGNPTLTWDTSVPPSVTFTNLQWSTSTSIVVKTTIASKVVTLASQLSSQWNISLLISNSSGYLLNDSGKQYITGTIPNFTSIYPLLFGAVASGPVTEPVVGNNNLTTQLQNQLNGNWVGNYLELMHQATNIPIVILALAFFMVILVNVASIFVDAFGPAAQKYIMLIMLPLFASGVIIGVVTLNLFIGMLLLAALVIVFVLYLARA